MDEFVAGPGFFVGGEEGFGGGGEGGAGFVTEAVAIPGAHFVVPEMVIVEEVHKDKVAGGNEGSGGRVTSRGGLE